MSTRSTITIINPDLSAKQVYCHWDGYLSYVGEILQTAYKSPRKVAQLISHGDMDHLGFTSEPANLYKDGITMDNDYDKIYKRFDGKADPYYQAITNKYTFYFNRDRHENSVDNEPYTFKPEEVKASWDVAMKCNDRPITKGFPKTNCSVAPGQEYNYIYDASSAHPQWYVTYTDLVDSKPVRNKRGTVIGSKDGHWVFCFKSLLKAIHESSIIKNPDKDLKKAQHNYEKFLANPYNPTYQQFCEAMTKKFKKPAGAKPSVKQNFINPQQMSLF